MEYSDAMLKRVLRDTQVIACVGASMNPVRPSYRVSDYMTGRGYRVIAVNPGHAGKMLFGEKLLPDLASIDGPVDMVDIFRRSEHVLPVVEMALETFPDLKSIWMQIGVKNQAAADLATARGVDVVMDRCPKIEYGRLFGDALRKDIAQNPK